MTRACAASLDDTAMEYVASGWGVARLGCGQDLEPGDDHRVHRPRPEGQKENEARSAAAKVC